MLLYYRVGTSPIKCSSKAVAFLQLLWIAKTPYAETQYAIVLQETIPAMKLNGVLAIHKT